MSVQVHVSDLNKTAKTVIVTAFENKNKIFKSPMSFKKFDKSAMEKQIRKELKAFESPVWGGLVCSFYVLVRGAQ